MEERNYNSNNTEFNNTQGANESFDQYNGQQQYNGYNGQQQYNQGCNNYNCTNCREKAVRKSISSIIWLLIVILYFLISFTTGAWHITWLIFLIGACVSSISGLVINLTRKY